MRYEAEIDLRNPNTSHTLLIELVGSDRRVLDVGCAAGDLGRVLRRHGCRVAGVEADPAAAEAAEKVLDEVLVGDVNDLDLVRHFGKGSFDVVVFGDVLEHLVDPISVLRKVRPLLDEGGSVVASIPNVAHGAVRLALLKGDFDYRPLGLLDSTHLRFFTRGSVYEVFRESGLVLLDVRRTTAGVFDTEIGLKRSDFEQGVVDAVESDPESTTYQFVLRAVPEDSPGAIGGHTPPAQPRRAATTVRVGLWARVDPDDVRSALTLRVTLAELSRRLPGGGVRCFYADHEARPSPHDGGMPIEALGPWSAERARRLAGELDCVVLTGDLPAAADAGRDGGTDPSRFLLEGPAGADVDCPVLWSAVRLPHGSEQALPEALRGSAYGTVLDEGPGMVGATGEGVAAVPDPLLLVPRLLRPEALARRLEFVRMMGWFPEDGEPVVVEIDETLRTHAAALARALDEVASKAGAGVVLLRADRRGVDGGAGDGAGDGGAGDGGAGDAADAVAAAMATPVYRVPGDALVDDVAAVVAGATAAVLRSPAALMLAIAYGVPAAHLDLGGDPAGSPVSAVPGGVGVVTAPEDLAGLLDRDRFPLPAGGVVAALQSRLDVHFDRLAVIADAAAAARPRTPDGRPVLPPSEYVAAMELAHRRMQQRLDAERHAVADHLGGLRGMHRAELARSRAELQRLRAERDHLEADLARATAGGPLRDEREERLRTELARVVAELEALKGIRVLRLLRPARALYARLRGSRL